MLYVNTIEFNGHKAVINSYTIGFVEQYKILRDEMEKQLAWFQSMYPKATVQTETLSDTTVIDMVAAVRYRGAPDVWDIGKASQGEA